MIGLALNFPQAPRDRLVAYSGPLTVPCVAPLSPLAVRSKVLETVLREATPTSRASLDRLRASIGAKSLDDPKSYAALRDDLEPYLQPWERGKEDIKAKMRAEFAVYSRMAGSHSPISAMSEEAFIFFLLDVHRRCAGGPGALREQPVGLRPDGRRNRVVFPDARWCPFLLRSLHGFLLRHLADHRGLCATVAFGAIVHAHPFNDGNGRTARTVFNLILSGPGAGRHFVPLHIIGTRWPGLFIKLKRALHGADWLSLQAFFADAARLSRNLQAAPRGRAGHPANSEGEKE